MRKIFMPIILFLFSMILFSCSGKKENVETKFVPIYEGVSIVENSSTHKLHRAQFLADDFDYGTIIPDIVVDSDITYYSAPGSTVRVEIHLKNPDQFEILSLTINDEKYQSYQFREGSNSEVLYIDVVVPKVSGEYQYLIDKIKYIDGDDILDVDMSNGNKTIKFGVTYDNLPTLNISHKEITKNSYKAIVQAVDNDGVIEKANGLKAFLFDEKKKLVTSKRLKGEELLIDNLSEGKNYHLVLSTGLDLLDGNGGKTYILYEETFATKSSVYFDVLDVRTNSVNYNIVKEGDSVVIDSVKLVDLANNKEIDVTNTNTINNVLSNHKYKLVLNYSNVNNKYTTSVLFTTLASKEPTISGFDLKADKESISFDYTILDLDNLVLKEEVILSKDGVVIDSVDAKNVKTFNNLLSGVTYQATLRITYDLNDGSGQKVLELTKDIKTIAKILPTIGIDYTVVENEFRGTLNIVDNDNVFVLDHFELYNNSGVLVKTLDDISVISNLITNANYELKVIYKYDLNDGAGEQIGEFVFDFSTGKQKPTLSVSVYETTDVSFSVDLKENDINNIGFIQTIRLYNANDVFIKEVVISNSFRFEDLNANSDYILKIEYSYDYFDGTGVKIDVYEEKIHTLNARPQLESFTVLPKKTSISYDLKTNDVNNAITDIKVSLYKDNMLVNDSPLNNVFNNLLSNTNYQVRLTIYYDLQDGKGTQSFVFTKDVRTFAKLAPSVGLDYTLNVNEFNGTLSLIDEDNVFKLNRYELLDVNGQLLKTIDDISSVKDLQLDTMYQIKVVYTYDLNDGKGEHLDYYVSHFKTSKKAPTISFSSHYRGEDAIYFDLPIDNPNNAVLFIENVRIYSSSNDFISDLYGTGASDSYSATLLEKNTLYKIKVRYSYDLYDGNGAQDKIVTFEVSTAKAMPHGSISAIGSKNTINYDFNIIDEDNTGKISKVNLLLNDKVVQSNLDYVFTNLLSNTEYVVEVLYTYDLNNDNGEQTLSIKQVVKTLGYNTKLETVNLVTTSDTISLDYKVTDETKTLKVNKLDVYENGELLVFTNNNIHSLTNILINNLKASTYYKLVTTYSYDSLDGKGPQTYELVTEYHTSTGSKLEINRIEIVNRETLYPGEYIDARIFINNVNNLNITAIFVNGIRVETTLSASDSVIIKYVPECSGGIYKMTVTGYEYAIKTDNKEFHIVETLNVSSEQNITVLGDLKDVTVHTSENLPYLVTTKSYVTIKYDGSAGYEIFNIITNAGEFTKDSFTVLGPNEIQFKLVGYHQYVGNLVIRTIEYGIKEDKRISTEKIITNIGIVPYDAKVVHVTKPEDLQFTTIAQDVYILDNDLDFSGFKHTPIHLSGVFLGNNHVIKNFSFSTQSNSQEYNKYAFFSVLGGYVENLTFVNPYISVKADHSIKVAVVAAVADSDAAMVNVNVVNGAVYVENNHAGTYSGLLVGECSNSYLSNISVDGISLRKNDEYYQASLLTGVLHFSQVKNVRLNGKASTAISSHVTNSIVENVHIKGNYNCGVVSGPSDGLLKNVLLEANYEFIFGFSRDIQLINMIYFNNPQYTSSMAQIKNIISFNGSGLRPSNGDKFENSYITDYDSTDADNIFIPREEVMNKEFYINLGFDENIWDFSNVDKLKFALKF